MRNIDRKLVFVQANKIDITIAFFSYHAICDEIVISLLLSLAILHFSNLSLRLSPLKKEIEIFILFYFLFREIALQSELKIKNYTKFSFKELLLTFRFTGQSNFCIRVYNLSYAKNLETNFLFFSSKKILNKIQNIKLFHSYENKIYFFIQNVYKIRLKLNIYEYFIFNICFVILSLFGQIFLVEFIFRFNCLFSMKPLKCLNKQLLTVLIAFKRSL